MRVGELEIFLYKMTKIFLDTQYIYYLYLVFETHFVTLRSISTAKAFLSLSPLSLSKSVSYFPSYCVFMDVLSLLFWY